MNTYRRFSDSGISLAPIGIAARDDNVPYFCTPKGTSIIGGADRPTAIVFGGSSKGKSVPCVPQCTLSLFKRTWTGVLHFTKKDMRISALHSFEHKPKTQSPVFRIDVRTHQQCAPQEDSAL